MEEKGKITSVNQKPGKYGIALGQDNWYNGMGTCPAKKGDQVKVTFEVNGQWKNIKNIEVLSSASPEPERSKGYNQEKAHTMLVSYAKDLAIEKKITMEDATNYVLASYWQVVDGLENRDNVVPVIKPGQ